MRIFKMARPHESRDNDLAHASSGTTLPRKCSQFTLANDLALPNIYLVMINHTGPHGMPTHPLSQILIGPDADEIDPAQYHSMKSWITSPSLSSLMSR